MRAKVIKKVKFLKQFENSQGGLVSLFVPLRSYQRPQVILSGLTSWANTILRRGGFSDINICSADWNYWLKSEHQTLAFFIKDSLTTIVPLKAQMAPRVIVASSFHVKPLLASLKDRQTLKALKDLEQWQSEGQYPTQVFTPSQGSTGESNEAVDQSSTEAQLQHLFHLIQSRSCKRIIIPLDDLIFGEIDYDNGVIRIKRMQENHRDDDILDDLMEIAIKKRIQVCVVNRSQLPKGKLYLAAS